MALKVINKMQITKGDPVTSTKSMTTTTKNTPRSMMPFFSPPLPFQFCAHQYHVENGFPSEIFPQLWGYECYPAKKHSSSVPQTKTEHSPPTMPLVKPQSSSPTLPVEPELSPPTSPLSSEHSLEKGRAKGKQQRNKNCDDVTKRRYTCDVCSDSFNYKHVLQNHIRTHTGEKPFVCKQCDKRFTRDHHLKTHMRLHTGERPYECKTCGKKFVQVANLRRHSRVHSDEELISSMAGFKRDAYSRFPIGKMNSSTGRELLPRVVTAAVYYPCQDEPEDLSLKSRLRVS